MNLESIDVAPLDVVTAVPDLRRDLHVFVDYVRAREVKRSHRGNALSKADTMNPPLEGNGIPAIR